MCYYSYFLPFFFSSQFVLVVVSYFIGGIGFVSAAKLDRAAGRFVAFAGGADANERVLCVNARSEEATRRAERKTTRSLVNKSDRVCPFDLDRIQPVVTCRFLRSVNSEHNSSLFAFFSFYLFDVFVGLVTRIWQIMYNYIPFASRRRRDV